MSVLLRAFATAVVAFAVMHILMDEAFTRDRELALQLRANREAVTARVASHEPRTGSCNMTLVGTTAAGVEFPAHDSQSNGCATAPAIGTLRDIVVWREDPTQFMHVEWLTQRDESGRTVSEAQDRWTIPAVVAGFLALVAGIVGYVSQRRVSKVHV